MKKAIFVRKVSNIGDLRKSIKEYALKPESYIIEKTIELDKKEFEDLVNNFFTNRTWIADNADKMWYKDGIWHCILAKCKECELGILIESEGYDYARYTAEIQV